MHSAEEDSAYTKEHVIVSHDQETASQGEETPVISSQSDRPLELCEHITQGVIPEPLEISETTDQSEELEETLEVEHAETHCVGESAPAPPSPLDINHIPQTDESPSLEPTIEELEVTSQRNELC